MMEFTIALALGAGLLSFLSPCVLPLVPAYLGQLSAVAVVGRAEGEPSRWLALRHALAYVVGFGAVFTNLGITATYAPDRCSTTCRSCARLAASCSSCSA